MILWNSGFSKILETVQLVIPRIHSWCDKLNPSCMVYGERTGRHCIELHIKTPIVNYWLTIVNRKRYKLRKDILLRSIPVVH